MKTAAKMLIYNAYGSIGNPSGWLLNLVMEKFYE